MTPNRNVAQGINAFRFRKGLDVILEGQPEQIVTTGISVSSVAVLGRDVHGIRPSLRVQAGDRVCSGDVLFVDRKNPAIAFTSPATGIVEAVNRGHRRILDSVVIAVEDDDPKMIQRPGGNLSRELVTTLLLKSGMWTAFISRPFGRIPDPKIVPDGIFVTAMDTNPLAADASIVLRPQLSQFRQGLEALKMLTEGPVYVCQQPAIPFAEDDEQIHTATFMGPHPSGLAGTHVHHLLPVSERRTVWQIRYDDVVGIGHLLETGHLMTERIISLAGSGVRRPRLVRTRLGANLDQLLKTEIKEGSFQTISGSVLSGWPSSYLGRHHAQVTVLRTDHANTSTNLLQRLFTIFPEASAGPTIPTEALDRAFPLDILTTPLMRALSVGDVETAIRLGCLELLEEDLALLSYLCPGKTNYGVLLRQVLEEFEGPPR